MMGRQRMISDDFWEDPDLSDLTTEERCTLILFLTCKQSNVVGVYRVIWRQVGAGAGWTQDQMLNAARNLKKKRCIDVDDSTGWVWIKEWWKHNSIRGAFTGNVGKKARDELLAVPEFWKQAVLQWISDNDHEGASKPLISPLQGAGGNPNPNPNLSPTTTMGGGVEEIDDLVEAAVWAARKAGEIKNEAGFRTKVRARILSSPNPEDLKSLHAWRKAQATLQIAATAANLPTGRWASRLGSVIEIGETGPVLVTTSAGEVKSLHREDVARDLQSGKVELLQLEEV